MLRKIRIALAAISFIAITLCFLDFTGTLRCYMGWLAKTQFIPAVLALNVVVVALLVVATLLFGRVYCSVIFPFGIMQDVVSWLHNRRKKGPCALWLQTRIAGFELRISCGVCCAYVGGADIDSRTD